MLSSGQIATIRTWIGSTTPPTDLELDPIMTRTGSLRGVVLDVLRARLADLTARPSQFAVAGDYSQTTSENIRSLERQIKLVESYDDTLTVSTTASGSSAAGLGVQQLVRRGRGR